MVISVNTIISSISVSICNIITMILIMSNSSSSSSCCCCSNSSSSSSSSSISIPIKYLLLLALLRLVGDVLLLRHLGDLVRLLLLPGNINGNINYS